MNFRYLYLAAAAAALTLAGWAAGDFRAFIHFFGIDTQQSDNYDVTSGVGPMAETFLLGSGLLATVWAHLNCHADGCPGLGRFHVAGGQYRVCRRHHAEITGRGRLHVPLLRELHETHGRHRA